MHSIGVTLLHSNSVLRPIFGNNGISVEVPINLGDAEVVFPHVFLQKPAFFVLDNPGGKQASKQASLREALAASGSLWEPLGSSGSLWELLGASGRISGSFCEALGVSESVWKPLGASGSPWELLGASGSLVGAFGSLWELLGAPGNLMSASGDSGSLW